MSWFRGAVASRCRGVAVLVSRCHGVVVWRRGTTAPWCRGAAKNKQKEKQYIRFRRRISMIMQRVLVKLIKSVRQRKHYNDDGASMTSNSKTGCLYGGK